jgi:hypothetical protein
MEARRSSVSSAPSTHEGRLISRSRPRGREIPVLQKADGRLSPQIVDRHSGRRAYIVMGSGSRGALSSRLLCLRSPTPIAMRPKIAKIMPKTQ